MLKKSVLSTVRAAFTITTSFIFLFKLTKTGKRRRRGQSETGHKQSRRTASSALVYRKELDASWFSRNLASDKSRLQDKARPLFLQNRQAWTAKQHENGSRCGKTPAYPQDQVCRTRHFWTTIVFVPDRFSFDTMLFQLIR
jgi:hypothetical protein